MTTKIINSIRVLTPADGMWLCDRNAHISSNQVWLGIHDTPDRWEEIATEEKEKLEAEWEAEWEAEEPEPENTDQREFDALVASYKDGVNHA